MFPVWLLGVVLAITASVVSNLGLNLQKRAHINMSHAEKAAREKDGHTPSARRNRTSSFSANSVSFADSRRGSNTVTPEKDGLNGTSNSNSNGNSSSREGKVNPLSPPSILKKHKQSNDYHLIGKDDEESDHRSPSSTHSNGNAYGGKRGSLLSAKRRSALPPIPPSPAVQDESPLIASADKDAPITNPSLPTFHSPEPKSFTSLNELAQNSIDLDEYTTGTARRASLNAASLNGSNHADKQAIAAARNRSMSAATGPSRRERRRSSVNVDGVSVRRERSGTVSGSAPAKSQGHYAKQPVWVLGLICVIAGSLLDFTALAFVDQAVVAPLGSLTLVSNVFFAPLLLKETVNRKQIICTLLIVAGSCLAVAFAPHADTSRDIGAMFDNFAHLRFIVYAGVCCIALGGLRFVCWKLNKRRRIDPHGYGKLAKYHTFAYAACAGIMGAQSVLFAKCTAMLLAASIAGDGLMFVYWGTYFVLLGLGVTIFLQIRWLNSGLRMFSALMIVPIFQSFWILVSVIAGMIFFNEYEGIFENPTHAALFPLGLGLTITGVYFLTKIGGSEAASDAHGSSSHLGSAVGKDGITHRRRSRSSARAASLSGLPGPLGTTTSPSNASAAASSVGSSRALSPSAASVSAPFAAANGGVPSTPLLKTANGVDYGVPSPRDTPPAPVATVSPTGMSKKESARPAPLAHAGHKSSLDRTVDLGSYSEGENEYLARANEEERLNGDELRSDEAELDEEEFGSSDEMSGSEDSDEQTTPYPNYAMHYLAPINFPLSLFPRALVDEPASPRPYFESNSSGFDEAADGGSNIGLGGLPYTSIFRVREEERNPEREFDEENPNTSPIANRSRPVGSPSRPNRGLNASDDASAHVLSPAKGDAVAEVEWTVPAARSHTSSRGSSYVAPSPYRSTAQSSLASSTAFSPHVHFGSGVTSPSTAFSPNLAAAVASPPIHGQPTPLDLNGFGSTVNDKSGSTPEFARSDSFSTADLDATQSHDALISSSSSNAIETTDAAADKQRKKKKKKVKMTNNREVEENLL